jgi:hypothetical protein
MLRDDLNSGVIQTPIRRTEDIEHLLHSRTYSMGRLMLKTGFYPYYAFRKLAIGALSFLSPRVKKKLRAMVDYFKLRLPNA